MTIAFSNGGNRDAAVLRVAEPALWSADRKPSAAWVSLIRQGPSEYSSHGAQDVADLKAGGVEVRHVVGGVERGRCRA